MVNLAPSNPNYNFEAKTVKSPPIRLVFEALKDILTEGNIIFDETGIKMLEMDTTRAVLVHLILNASDFEFYYCAPGKRFVCSINMSNFHKIIKSIGNDDIVSLYQDIDEPTELGMDIENPNAHSIKKVKFKLLDTDEVKISIPAAVFDKVINVPTAMLQKICRDFSALTENIEIKSVNNQLIFSCDCNLGHVEETISESNNAISIKEGNNTQIMQGVFKLKHLVTFTKCSNLCQHVELLLQNNFPLILDYKVASLGQLRLCLAPKLDNS
jgi:proliferating cell nuclear antigen